ncbi:MAG TPA: F0F1 ATP synthase subunit delta [Polyangiaceae bacterium]|jgi:F-type H+-transporting ATPase subunit delta|nr:F0F1 ATP synthase subunit delta [Polyangiaceae bacterium]
MSGQATIAERYARAIFELGVESGTLAALVDQVRSFAAAYEESADLRGVLENPLVPNEQRDKILREIASRLDFGPSALNTVRYLARRRRLAVLPDIARRLDSLSDEKQGVVRATVTSATPLAESFYQRLAEQLATLVGKKVVLDRHQDPSLIAGVVTRIGDNTIDGSVRGRLENLERKLLS